MSKKKKAEKAPSEVMERAAHSTLVMVDNTLPRPVVVACQGEDPKTLESVIIKVNFKPHRHPMDRAHVDLALAHPWLRAYVKRVKGDDAEPRDVFRVKPYYPEDDA